MLPDCLSDYEKIFLNLDLEFDCTAFETSQSGFTAVHFFPSLRRMSEVPQVGLRDFDTAVNLTI